ncbi:uncharacterized protein LOC127289150 [Leptopilina boulardi]|uniref:uncharacterized protein LOC127289150 n=1 Tax=Leptopilina boulardi TaxID=63433 RepID=UPI0021F5EC13|nr:uncharacterized protein LOC127289150 [Leptopilina boulardi]
MMHTPPPGVPQRRDGASRDTDISNTGGENPTPLRRSERENKGVPPPRYDPNLKIHVSVNRPASRHGSKYSIPSALSSRSGRTPTGAPPSVTSGNMRTPSVISRHSSNSQTRESRQLEIELRKQEELAELEQQQAERERRIIELRARLEESKLNDDDGQKMRSLNSNASERSVKTITSSQLKVADWLQRENTQDDIPVAREFKRHSEFTGTRPKANGKGLNVNTPPVNNTYMARQAIGKDLPIFKGSTTDWILFERMFYQTTEACGFSSAENMLRLQKCLQGDALEAVRALIMTTNVERVMDVLRRRFGRAEYIIEDIMNKVTNTSNVKDDQPLTMIRFAENVTNLVATIESLDQPAYLTNPLLIRQLVNKLPATSRMNWGKRVARDKDGTNLVCFANWITEEAEAASAIYQPSIEKDKNQKRVYSCNENVDGEQKKCNFCNNNSHSTDACSGYKKMSVDDRWKWVREKGVCFGCLSSEHSIRKCTRGRCKRQGCRLRHHTSLHNDFYKKREKGNEKPTDTSETRSESSVHNSVEQVTFTNKSARRVYLRILPVTLRGPDREIDTFALLDGGSTVSLISEEMADRLSLQGPRRPLIASWYDNTTNEDHSSRQVSLEIKGLNGKVYKINNVRTTKMQMPGQTMNVNLDKWPYLRDLDIPDLENAKPTIMIGEDNVHLKKIIQQVTGKVGTPAATLTPLGWMIHGPDSYEKADKDRLFFVQHSNDDKDLNDAVRNFWTTESFGVSPSSRNLNTKEDQRAQKVLDETLKRVGKRWEAGLLWKTSQEILPASRETAVKRLLSIERKMIKEPEFGKRYSANMQAYVEKGYARKLSDEQARYTTDTTWYLPHFATFNPQKPDKLRMVFDAAAKSHGVSLNDRLLKGPDLLQSLPGILFKFREKRIAICGDLREMFHQVRIREQDCSSQRFLWRNPDTQEIETLEMAVMIFGAVSSPFIAQEVKNRNAAEFREKYPGAYKAIVENHYMDDFVDSEDTVEETVKKVSEVMYVHEMGGFEMRNIMTNSAEVREKLNPAYLAPLNKNLSLNEESNARVLGVNWTPSTDNLFFSVKFPKLEKTLLTGETPPTKRQLLKILMSLFDPLGLLSPLTIRAKILLQDIWKEGTQWDEEVPAGIAKLWSEWLDDLRSSEKLRIPRHYMNGMEKTSELQLHVFCDASVQAFAAAAYLRMEGENEIRVTLVTSKTRVAPIKLLTVPRLELQSAVMAARLAAFVRKEHNLNIDKVVFWSDSQTALSWIKSDARKYLPFVAHRIAEILDITSPTDWRWVPTKDNVADLATRSKIDEKLDQSSRWFQGPDFLYRPETEWPAQKTQDGQSENVTSEMRKECCFAITVESTLKIQRSRKTLTWLYTVRVMAWVQRFIDRCKRKSDSYTTWELTGTEIQRAEETVLKQSQKESFPEEWQRLQTTKQVPSSSKIFSLSPVFKDGLIRLDGRVTDKNGSTFQPIILDSDNHLIKLLILHYHWKTGHHGRERVVNDLRQFYWVTKIRTAVRRSWNDCRLCTLLRKKPMIPRMAPLPEPRLQDNIAAFTNTGIDYFGPLLVTIGRRREKRYGVLFTCLTVRAVHIEIAASLDTDSMLMALRRMMARRGSPKRIYSDNGTNFRGASEELKKAVRELDKNEILRQSSAEKIEWHFIPPASPHMGGCWERLIGSVKRTLAVTLKERAPREEVLQTLLAEAEYSINSRPLTYVSDDPSDLRSLTPNDFLGVQPGTVRLTHGPPCLSPSVTGAETLRRQWRYSQCLTDQFWKRWIKEYLPSINRRAKWHRERPDLQVNDLVVIWDENAPRNQWKRGRVTTVYPGRDGRVRVADVLTATGILKRSAAKLCVLETL